MAEHTRHRPGTTQAPRRSVAGIGRVLLWSGGSLWIGREAGRVEPHAHHAIQITLAMDAAFLMRDGDGGWREHGDGEERDGHERHGLPGQGRQPDERGPADDLEAGTQRGRGGVGHRPSLA